MIQFNTFIVSLTNTYLIPVIGALIGKQKGRTLEIMNSFELVYTTLLDKIVIDRDYYNTKEEQCKFIIFISINRYLILVFK